MYLLPGGLFNSGGMERVITLKANFLADKAGYEISIVTTEQNSRPVFFPLSKKIKLFHLDIGIYNRYGNESFFEKYFSRKRDTRRYKKAVVELLIKEKPDFVISTFGLDIAFLTSLKDGSIKLAELHASGEFRNISAKTISKNPIQHLVSSIRTWQMHRISTKFNKIILLTEEEKSYWKKNQNILIIPNPLPLYPEKQANPVSKKAIAVGRLCYEKGFDRLIEAWVPIKEKYPEWTLSIFGGGESEYILQQQIQKHGLEQHIILHPPVQNIYEQYPQHSFLVMTSRNEAFPMVITEAMSCGIAVVAFTCRCGPKDLIDNEKNGLWVKPDDIVDLSEKISRMIDSENDRIQMGKAAREKASSYRIEVVMQHWIELFENIKKQQG